MSRKKKPKDWQPNETERLAVTDFLQARSDAIPAPRLKAKERDDGKQSLLMDHADDTAWIATFCRAFGTLSSDFAGTQLDLLTNAVTTGDETSERECNAMLAALHSIQPTDEIEAMLVSQMLAVNKAAMRMARRLNHVETIDQQNSAANALTKLTRTFTAQMEALNRHRGKGQQKMTVEHVHVHQGGQAIVGNVQNKGGGDAEKNGDQAHALAYAPGTTLSCEDTERDAVPITSRKRKA